MNPNDVNDKKEPRDIDPSAETSASGSTLLHMFDDIEDPSTDIDMTGRSISSIEADSASSYGVDSIDSVTEAYDPYVPGTRMGDPLAEVELGDSDDTGICMHFLTDEDEAADILDPVYETNASAYSLMFSDDK